MYRAGMAAILSELAARIVWSIVDSIAVEAPKTKLFRAEDQGHGPGSVRAGRYRRARRKPVSGSSRNLPNVLVLEVNETDPVSLIRFPKGSDDQERRRQVRGGGDEPERLMQVLLAPQISEKATWVADKNSR